MLATVVTTMDEKTIGQVRAAKARKPTTDEIQTLRELMWETLCNMVLLVDSEEVMPVALKTTLKNVAVRFEAFADKMEVIFTREEARAEKAALKKEFSGMTVEQFVEFRELKRAQKLAEDLFVEEE